MNLNDAERLARKLMSEWLGAGYFFGWSNRRGAAGDYNYRTRTIRLSKPFVEINQREIVENTILHEIAHAIGTPEDGHGPNWKRNARRVGAIPVSCVNQTGLEAALPAGKFQATCSTCQEVYNRHRWTKNMNGKLACTLCCRKHNGGQYSAKYVLTFVQRW